MNQVDVKLIVPPQWTPQNPPFALYSIGGHLRSKGIPVTLLDYNLRFYEHILSPEYIKYSKELAMLRRSYLQNKSIFKLAAEDCSEQFQIEAAQVLELDKNFESGCDPWLNAASKIEQSVSVMRNPSLFYDPASLVNALMVIDEALRLVSLPYFPTRISLNDYRNQLCSLNFSDLEHFTKDKYTNIFIDFYKDVMNELKPSEQKPSDQKPSDQKQQETSSKQKKSRQKQETGNMQNHSPHIIAISINAFSQVIPGLTLARMLKEKYGSSFRLCIGGNFFGRLKDALMKRPEFFNLFCDYLILEEGEEAMASLAKAVGGGTPLDTVPRLLYLDDATATVKYTFEEKRLPLEEIGFMDLKDLKLDRYFTPQPVVCIQYSRGCYYGKCSFCDAYFGVQYNKKSVDHLIAEMKYLKEHYGIINYEFIDECIRPDEMKIISERISQEKLGVRWFSNARTEPQFTPEIFSAMKDGGLTMLLWGIESGSKRIMQLIQKGVAAKERLDILKNARNAGIWNFAYIFFGFPSETREEAMETIQMICQNTDIINSYGKSHFTLGKHSPLRRLAEKYRIVDLIEDDQEFSTNLFYKTTRGMTGEDVNAVSELCTTLCYEAYKSPLWMYLRNRENLHLYLAKYGHEYLASTNLCPPSGKNNTDELTKTLIQFQK